MATSRRRPVAGRAARRRVGQLRPLLVSVHVLGTLSFAPYVAFFVGVAIQTAVILPVVLLLFRGLRRSDAIGTGCGAVLTLVLLAEAAAWIAFMIPEGRGQFGTVTVQSGAYGAALAITAASALAVTVRWRPRICPGPSGRVTRCAT